MSNAVLGVQFTVSLLAAAGVVVYILRRHQRHLEELTRDVDMLIREERRRRGHLEERVARVERKPTSKHEAVTVELPRARVVR